MLLRQSEVASQAVVSPGVELLSTAMDLLENVCLSGVVL
jgi:hypothetical protein